MACKKYVQHRGLYVADHGTFGLSLIFMENICGPYDLLIYEMPETFKGNDIVLVYSFNEKNVMTPFHMRVVGFTATGGVEVRTWKLASELPFPSSTSWHVC